MAEKSKKITICIIIATLLIACFLVSAEWLPLRLSQDTHKNTWLQGILGQVCGIIAVIVIIRYMRLRLFKRPQNVLWAIPCLLVAVNNFPFISYFNGNMAFVNASIENVIVFAIYCLAVGFFEEIVFRGVLFTLIAERMTKDKKGLVKTFVFSSCVFGIAHIFNMFGGNVGGTLLQVGYTTLTGGLFAFTLIKTKNIACCAFVHGTYNFCGLLLSKQGLGAGIVFDYGTTLMTAIIVVIATIYVVYGLYTYKTEEVNVLYERLHIKQAEEC